MILESNQEPDWQSELIDDIGAFTHDPVGFVEYAWAGCDLIDWHGPRPWQQETLEIIGAHLQNPETVHQPCQIAIMSGHGIGKSALIAMITAWGMSTCEDCKIIVTANTGTQLSTKTVPEVHKWFHLAINAHWFDLKATSITIKDEDHERGWRTDFITWSENNSQAFAGMHNKGKRIIIIFDEASDIADIIWEVIDGALSDEDTEIIWIACGNPEKNSGRFIECFGRFKHRWKTKQIDSRKVEGTNKVKIAQDAADWGEDSDFFRVRWRGELPRAGSSQFIASDVVATARRFKAAGYESLPKILPVDVARFGDDQSVIGLRQGRKFQILAKYRGLDTAQLAERVIEFIVSERPDGIVVDGDGLGAGVVDHLAFRGYKCFEFHGGAAANDAAMYFNRRAEVWGLMREALAGPMEIPDLPDLEVDLTGPKYGFSNKQQIQLEKKEDMKERGLASPDFGDCLAMSFAVKIAARKTSARPRRPVSAWS